MSDSTTEELTSLNANQGSWDMRLIVLISIAAIFTLAMGILPFINSEWAASPARILFDLLLPLLWTLVGMQLNTHSIERQANQRWIPQAEAACESLMATWCDVRCLEEELRNRCALVARDFPDLEKSGHGVKIVIDMTCSSASSRLKTTANLLRTAVNNWLRFMNSNCEGEDCKRISGSLNKRSLEYEAQIREVKNSNCGAAARKDS